MAQPVLYQPAALPQPRLRGIFDAEQTVFTLYRVVLQFEERIMAGIPSDPNIVSKWLASKMGVTDEAELIRLTAQTMNQSGMVEAQPGMTMEQLTEIAERYAQEKSTNVFKRDHAIGIYVEPRQLKAALKEAINSLYPHERKWGLTGKSARGMAAERVHIKGNRLYLCRPRDPEDFSPIEWEDPSLVQVMATESGTETFVGHTTGPTGPKSNLTRVQYAGFPDVPPRIYATVAVAEDFISEDHWKRIWVHAQEIGLGSLRSQSQGKYSVYQFERVFKGDDMPKLPTKAKAGKNGAPSEEEVLAAV